jgi:hypothetical protein
VALYSIRLDASSEETLATAARERKVSRAVILREAIAEYAGAAVRDASPFAQLSSLIGVIDDGPGNLSEKTGQGFAELLRQRGASANKVGTSAPKRRTNKAKQ